MYTKNIMIQEYSQEMFDDLQQVTPHITLRKEHFRHAPKTIGDRIAKTIVHFSAACADFLFMERYGHRAVVLETIASVPGMVGGLFQHLKSLRLISDDRGWIKTLLDEAENERMHLLIYSGIAKPNVVERALIIIVQFFFFIIYFLLYLFSPRTAHRVVGYFEEEAIHSYEHYLRLVHEGKHENIPATPLARGYWNLMDDAKLTDMIEATIVDEMAHRDVNHKFSDDPTGTTMWRA
jgi:ubiquinol oxidase